MGIGRIASFLGSLSPAAADANAAAAADQPAPEISSEAERSAPSQDHDRDRQSGNTGDLTAQLQTMITAVRQLNDNAVQQGAAVAVSPAGTQLRNAVVGLGHLLSAVDAKTAATSAQNQLQQANAVIDSVENGLAATLVHAEEVLAHLPPDQAANARAVSDRFQNQMRDAVGQVRGVLGTLLK